MQDACLRPNFLMFFLSLVNCAVTLDFYQYSATIRGVLLSLIFLHYHGTPKMRNCLKLLGVICIAMLMTNITSAQCPIEGVYVAADGVNTTALDGGPWFDGGNNDWLDQSGGPGSLNNNNMLTGGIFTGTTEPNGGFQLGNEGDSDIVSTFVLTPGQQYEVSLIWQYPIFINAPVVFAGLSPAPTTQIPPRDDAKQVIPEPVQSIYFAATVPLGTVTANADGEVQVFISNGVSGSSNAGAYSGCAFVEAGSSCTPASAFTVFRGVQLTGALVDSFESDDSRLLFNPGFVLNSDEAPVWLIFDATLSGDSPNSLEITAESQAGTPGLTGTFEAWNWNSSAYEIIDVSPTSFNSDAVVTVDLTSGISDYVQTGTGAVRSRIGWRQTGFTINFPWEVRLDQLVWTAN